MSWLKHAGTPVERPFAVLLTVTWLLLIILAFATIAVVDDLNVQRYRELFPETTDEGLELVRNTALGQTVFLSALLLGALFCVARGWRFSRRIWLLALVFAGFGKLPSILLQAVPLIVSLLVDKTVSFKGLAESAIPLAIIFGIGLNFCIASSLLFSSPVRRWRAALRERNFVNLPPKDVLP